MIEKDRCWEEMQKRMELKYAECSGLKTPRQLMDYGGLYSWEISKKVVLQSLIEPNRRI